MIKKLRDTDNKYILFIYEHMDILLFILSMILIDLALRWRVGMELFKVRHMIFTFSALFVLSGCLLILNKKARNIAEGIIVFAGAVYAFTQRFHYGFFNLFYSFQKLMLMNELNGVAESVVSKLAKRDLIFLLPFLFFIFCIFFMNNIRKEDTVKKESKPLFIKYILVIIMIVSGIGLNAWMKATFPEAKSWSLDDEYNYQNLANKQRAIDEFGLWTYSYLDVKNVSSIFLFKDNKDEISTIDAAIEPLRPDLADNEYTGIFKDKNLILIQAESLSNYALNEAYMPVLSQMAKEGLSFTNHYAPMYQSATADTEFIAQTSLIPSIDYGSTAYTFHHNYYPYSLANQFSKMGYDVNSFHSYLRVFYNREIFHESFGFDSYNDKELLGFVYPEDYMEGINWPSDVELMDRMMIWTQNKQLDKFYNFVITATGHMPYVYFRMEYTNYYWDILEEFGLSEELTAYISTQRLFDNSLKLLMNKLEEAGQLDDTVIVVYGDHFPYGLPEQTLDDIFGTSVEKYKVPWVIWTKDQTLQGQIDDVVSTFDILPTLNNLFGLEKEEEMYYVGNDYFSGNDSVVYFYDRSWLTNDFYYDSSKDELTIYNEEMTEEDAQPIMEKTKKVLELSQKILNSNYFSE